MKNLFLLLLGFFFSLAVSSQTVIYHENFEAPSFGDSVASSGTPNPWAINTRIYAEGLRCDSNYVQASDTSYLTTGVINCTGYPNLILQFSHICKIEIPDAGEIEISINNGPWTKLTGTQYLNPGSSQFVNSGNKFSVTTYVAPAVWQFSVPAAKPDNSWWMPEQFDISALAGNQANVRIRFVLRDGNGNGANLHHGWFIDNIKIMGAASELIPPTITYKPPVVQDTIFNTGPFDIYAWIKDPSGIDTAWLTYTVNGGANQYLPMAWVSDSTYKATIPSYTWNTAISYFVHAVDNSISHNVANGATKSFYIKQGPSNIIIGTGTSTQGYPFYMYWGYTRSASVYAQSEINSYGSILSLAWNVATAASANDPVKVYMKTIAGTTVTSDTWANLISGATLVYDGTTNFSTTGWKTFTLSTPFSYTSGNLLVLCESNYGGGGTSPYPYFYYSSATNKHEAFYADNTPPGTTGSVGSSRPNITIGFQPTNYIFDAGVSQITSPVGTMLGFGPHPVTVNIKNFSVDTLNTVKVKYKVDGIVRDSITWTGQLFAGVSSSSFNIDTTNYTIGLHTIKAWTEYPNGSADQANSNDTATASFFVCDALLNGTYTIGSTGDFTSLASAIGTLNNCGISGPVTFLVDAGTYNEQLTFNTINGSSLVNTVTFKPNIGATVTITNNSTTSTIKFAGTDNIIFDGSNNGTTSRDMTITNISTSGNTAAIWLASAGTGAGCNHITLKNCNISTGSNTATTYGICVGGSSIGSNGDDNDNLIIRNNNLTKTYNGIWVRANATGLLDSLKIDQNTIGSNTPADMVQYRGVDLQGATSPIIEKNHIFNMQTSGSLNVAGIDIGQNTFGAVIKKNEIHGLRSTSTGGYGAYGINVNSGTWVSDILISNNFIYDIVTAKYSATSTTWNPFGIRLTGGTNIKVYNNSINMFGAPTTGSSASMSAALMITSTTVTGIDIRDNIFANSMTGLAGSKSYCIFVPSGFSFSGSTINYNDYYPSGTFGFAGYSGADQLTLTNWKAFTTQDVNSVSVNPVFSSNTNLHTFANSVNNIGTPLVLVVDDFDGEVRDVSTPDIGADEFTPLANDLAIISIVTPVSGCGYSSSEAVSIRIKNMGSDTIHVAEMYFTLNNGTPVHETFNGTIATDSIKTYNFTTTADLSAPGNYTIKAYVNLLNDPNNLNDTLTRNFYSSYDFGYGAYTMGFEPSEYFGDWLVTNVNGDGETWNLPYNGSAHTGSYSSCYYNSTATSGNEWLFSRCFTFEAGRTYKIEYWYKTDNASYPQSIDLKVGTTATPAGMTTTLIAMPLISNTTYQKATVTYVPSSNGSYYFGWHAYSAANNFYYAYIDDINITLVPEQEASLISIVNPVTGCGLSNSEIVTIKIINTGADTINGNFTGYYQIVGGTVVSEAISAAIYPSDTLIFPFTQTADLSVISNDSLFNLDTWIVLSGDPFQFNDSLSSQIGSAHVPADPIAFSDTVAYGNSATLVAISPDALYWYNSPSGGFSVGTGDTLITPALFNYGYYWVEAKTSGGLTTWTFNNDLQGWTVQNPCGSATNWLWESDGGLGTMHAPNPATYSYQLITSPTVSVAGSSSASLWFTHKYDTESGWDEGYVAYKLDNGAWVQFTPTVNAYNDAGNNIDNDPLNGCVGITKPCYTGGPSAYMTSSGNINTAGASNIQLAFVFTSDVSGGATGWYIDNISLNAGMGGCASNRVPDTAYLTLFPQEAGILDVITPMDGCTEGLETVSIIIKNNGSDTISDSLTAYYSINGAPIVAEAVNATILSGDSLNFVFTTQFDPSLSITNIDSTYVITTYVDLANDVFFSNDTVIKTVTLGYVPPVPTVFNATIPYGTSASLNAISSDTVFWYSSPSGGSPLSIGNIYNTPLLYANTVFFAESKVYIPAQVFNVGNGTTPMYYVPNYGLYDYSWSAALFTGSELGFIGTIDTIMYKVNNTITSYTMLDQRIYMANTALNVFPTADKPDPATMTEVFTGDITWSGPGWQKIALQTPFTYDSTQSLMIYYENNDGSWTSGYPSFSGTATTGSKAIYDYADVTMPTITGHTSTNRPNMRFSMSLEGCSSERVPDTVFITGTPACDVGVEVIYSPVSGIELTSNEPVIIRIKNYGTDPASNIPVNYSINGTGLVNEIISGPIAPGDTLLYTFTTSADVDSIMTYNMVAYTSLICDTIFVNDTSYSSFINDTLTFCISEADYTTDDDIGNVTFANINNGSGTPILNNPDAIHSYSSFTYLPPAQVIAGSSVPISITQIEDDATWYECLVKVYIDFNRNGLWDLPAELVFSSSTGYDSNFPTVSGTVDIPTTGVVYGQDLRMRIVLDEFNVAPPCGTYSFGETEDYLVVVSPQIPFDAGVTGINQPLAYQAEGDVVPVEVIIKNFGTDTIKNANNMLVEYSLNGLAPVSTTWTGGNILPGASVICTLPTIIVPPGNNDICAWTVLPADINYGNDTNCKSFYGNPGIDAGVTQFLQPVSLSVLEGAVENVEVVISNFGSDTLFSIPVSYSFNGILLATQTWTGTLLPGEVDTVLFTQTYITPAGSFDLCSNTGLLSDGDHSNDTLCISPYGLFTSTLPYYDNFDGTVNWTQTDDGSGSIWELGMPAYGVTNSTHSAPNAWDINLSSAYTSSAEAMLYTQNFDFSTAVNAKMAFWLNYDLEGITTFYDGVRLEYTTDTGNTWNVLGTMADPNAVNWYITNSLYSSSLPGWCGTSSSWEKSEYNLDTLNGIPNVRFRFVFNSDISIAYDGISLDDFSITIPSPIDAGIEQIKQPLTNSPVGSLKTVKVLVRNFGSDTLFTIPLAYTINGGTPVQATYTGQLLPGDTITYTFATQFAVPGGLYSLCSYTEVPGDGDNLNDTTCIDLMGVMTFTVPWSDDMEGTVYWFDQNGNESWEYGVPAATTINTAHSPTQCWATNLDGYYMNSSLDYLYTPYLSFTQVNDAHLEFWHWYQTENGVDGGKIKYSLNGTTWITLGIVGDPAATNWYTSNFGGSPYWSGNSSGWILSTFDLGTIPAIVNATAPVQFRFEFMSSATNSSFDGWAVDDFSIIAPSIALDAGVIAVVDPIATTITGDAVSIQVTIQNFGTDSLHSIPVAYAINGGAYTQETWIGNLAPDSTTNFDFTTTYTSPSGLYNLCAFTKLAGDIYKFNDTTCVSIEGTAAPLDAGVTAMLNPGLTTPAGDSVEVKVRIQNLGTSVLTSIPLGYNRNGLQIITETWTGSLLAGDSVDYIFNQKFISPVLNYSLCAYSLLPGDANAANDQICIYPIGVSGIQEYSDGEFLLWQSIPNPANELTSIQFQIPVNGKVLFEVRDVLGQITYTETFNKDAGKHSIVLNLNAFSPGIYYYSVEFDGKRLTKKMVVN